jgi:hypothetical protein
MKKLDVVQQLSTYLLELLFVIQSLLIMSKKLVNNLTPPEDEIIFISSIVTYLSAACLVLHVLLLHEHDNPSLLEQRLNWQQFKDKYAKRADFKCHLRMSIESFNKLLSFIHPQLEVDEDMASLRGGVIMPEIALYCTLRYLAGGSYLDIRFFTGISTSSFYRVVWKTIKAINQCQELRINFPQTTDEVLEAALGFQKISQNGCIWNCTSVVDGYHLAIQTPSKEEVGNVRSFFSGHYQTYGLNVQGACDAECRFQYIGVAGPGVMGDREALFEIELGNLIENLPGLYCAIMDCAYIPSEHCVPIFGGSQALNKKNDDFNFYASQLRIRIEMAFGLMVKKWGILQRPLSMKVRNMKFLIVAIGQLHNFCISERLETTGKGLHECNIEMSPHEVALRQMAAEIELDDIINQFEDNWSINRKRMVDEIASLQISRPQASRKRNHGRMMS